MSNRRTFLLGLGSGIIIGALLLQLFIMGETSQDRLNEIGQELGNDPLGNGIATGAPDQAATASPEAEAPAEAVPKATPEPALSPTTSPTAGTATAAAVDKPLRLIHIEKGMKLVHTGDLLVANEVIANADAFVDQMLAADQVAKAGYYVLAKGAGVEAAIKAVTGQPLSKYAAERMIAEQK